MWKCGRSVHVPANKGYGYRYAVHGQSHVGCHVIDKEIRACVVGAQFLKGLIPVNRFLIPSFWGGSGDEISILHFMALIM